LLAQHSFFKMEQITEKDEEHRRTTDEEILESLA
jgi:hypothetical protein